MIDLLPRARPGIEFLDPRPVVDVEEAEYWRLLGYPKHHVPGERALELAARAQRYFADNAHPWFYAREAPLQIAGEILRIDGVEFASPRLRDHLLQTGARRVMLVAVSAGRECEDHAHRLWQEAKPDEYFFLEMFGSAVVEHLIATTSGRFCDLVERDGLMAVPHYSPGYVGWDIADQHRLFELIARGATLQFPAPMEVLASGMLRPKKSLLAVVGLAPRLERTKASVLRVPCTHCSFSPCHYRRAPYRHAPIQPESISVTPALAPRPISGLPLVRDANYSVNPRALRKWSQERVRIERLRDGSLSVTFRFEGKTCSSQGRSLAFDYVVALSAPESDYTILQADCRPAPGDEGHTYMCAYLNDAASLMKAISTEKPLLKRPLNAVLRWNRAPALSGCYCSPESREHKWGLALETIHYALAQADGGASAPAISKPDATSP